MTTDMDLNFTPEEEAFRAEVQAFLKDKLPARIANKVKAGKRLTKADQEEWHAILNERGWLANHWPEQYGGPGWGAVEKFIFDNECALAGGPRIVPFGVNMLGPVLIKYGNEAQKQYWLPRILSGEDWWCQGYSEPGAGSDLASVKTTAVRGVDAQGDHYIVNGQKTWTTQGQHANMIFCLVRTDREAQAPVGHQLPAGGHEHARRGVRPIRTLDGDTRGQRSVLHRRARARREPGGRGNKGWTYAKYLLTYERTGIAGVGFSVARWKSSRWWPPRCRRTAARWPGPAVCRPHGPGRDRPGKHEDHQPARDCRRGRWRRAGCRELDAQDPRHRDPPGNFVADAPRHGAVCAALH
jgi:alkylation response protein AidB-like acyl-CoA dehydrogenase